MRVETEMIKKYVTDDGRVFYDMEDAEKYESRLILNEVFKTVQHVGEYAIYKITNKNELEQLITCKEDTYYRCDVEFDLDSEFLFPMYICEETNNVYFFYRYSLLDDIIIKQIQILDGLKAIQSK